MTYSAVWHAPKELQSRPQSVVQNKCLQMISGACRPTTIKGLEAETFVSQIITSHSATSKVKIHQMPKTGQAKSIAKACKRIAAQLRSKPGLQRMATENPARPGKYAWAQSITQKRVPPPPTSRPILPPFGLHGKKRQKSSAETKAPIV